MGMMKNAALWNLTVNVDSLKENIIGTKLMQNITIIQRSQDHLATPEVSQIHLGISTILIAQEKLFSRSIYFHNNTN